MKEVTQLTGLNLRLEPADLQDGEAAKLVNLDPNVEPGALVLRKGMAILGQIPESSSSNLRTVAKVNGIRYQIAGRTIWRNFTRITTDLLDASQETSIVPFRPLNDDTIWAFIADDAKMLKDDGTNLYLWGIDLIPTPGPKLVNQTGKDASDTITAGTYLCAVTQLRMI